MAEPYRNGPLRFDHTTPYLMCLIVFSFDPDAAQKLIVLANRDEFLARETRQAQFWEEAPGLLAGRDLVAGGTWLGVHSSGRFAAVTNYREPANIRQDADSRGGLVLEFLKGSDPSESYLKALESDYGRYNGFNLVVYDGESLGYASNRSSEGPRLLPSGLYGLSNDLLDTPWPKVSRAKARFQEVLSSSPHADSIWSDPTFLDVLGDESLAPDEELPNTGVGLELERVLSAMTIRTENYGTRSTTLVDMMANGSIRFVEKTLQPSIPNPATVQFQIQAPEQPGPSKSGLQNL
jgi:uncharacterized protein with NRDE domain